VAAFEQNWLLYLLVALFGSEWSCRQWVDFGFCQIINQSTIDEINPAFIVKC
jgi:hypothetical protein